VVASFLPQLRDSSVAKSEFSTEEFHQHSGLAQSALMCIDVLARFLGKRLDWGPIITETLQELMVFAELLCGLASPAPAGAAVDSTAAAASGKKAKNSSSKSAGTHDAKAALALHMEYVKLLGSTVLCTATLSSVLGATALTILPVSTDVYPFVVSILVYLQNLYRC
jgi:hypothetical protein